ncbi:MAG: ester cyclase [Anaerolineae bacterium]
MTVEENKTLFRRYIGEVYNKGNVAVIDELLAPNFVHHNLPPGVRPDREGLKQFVTVLLAGFPDFRITVEDMVAEGDKVVVRATWRGTHKGEFIGIPPTGRQVTVTEIGIHRIEGGKVSESRVEVDQLGMMQQLGVVPPPGQGGG